MPWKGKIEFHETITIETSPSERTKGNARMAAPTERQVRPVESYLSEIGFDLFL